MGKRREARERAVQFLFQHDLNPPENLEAELAHFWNSQTAAAIDDEKSGMAKWGEKIELPPPTVDPAAMASIPSVRCNAGSCSTCPIPAV